MSTNATIIAKRANGRYGAIHCQWDGYVEHAGAILLKHYDTLEKVEALLALGDISQLAPRATPTGPHSYLKPEADVVVAYHRDRGEPAQPASEADTAAEQVETYGNSYSYIFEDGKWTFTMGAGEPIEDLAADIEKLRAKGKHIFA